jgi:hypothetical protein
MQPVQFYTPEALRVPAFPEPPKFARSHQMMECLRAEFLYTEKRIRDLLFREIEALLAITAPVAVSRLIRAAAARACRRAARLGLPSANWNIASRATVHAMLAAGVILRPDGSPILRTPDATSNQAAALQPNFPDATEAFLLEFLIRKLGDVTPRDHTALAHVLFRQFDPSIPLANLEARVSDLLSSLSHRVLLTPDGTYFA